MGVRLWSSPAEPNCGVSYMPIMTTSNALPPEPTSRVVTSRSLPSSRIVYFTLMPVFAVKSEGVSDAMSCICGFTTIATLIVLAAVPPIAVAASDASATIPATKTPTRTFARRRVLPFGGSCMADASSRADDGGATRDPDRYRFAYVVDAISVRRTDSDGRLEDNVVRKPLSRAVRWLYDQL